MALTDKHPEYVNRLGEWIQMDDTYEGERAIKSKRLDYLPATEGMVQDGMTTQTSPGWKDYEAYLMRAIYHDVVKSAVKAMIGVMHEKPAQFILPTRLEKMLTSATINSESLQQLLRRINVHQLVKGRCGLLLDAPDKVDIDKATPYISFYDATRIINWDAGKINEGKNDLDMVVLDESSYKRVGFTWKTQRKYRILTRGADALEDGWERPPAGAPYAMALKIDDTSMPVLEDFKYPSIGGRTIENGIPFQFIGANDLVPEPEVSPLLGLSNLALAIYRGEADYRQTLYLQGQNTLVIIGGNVDDAAEGGGGQLRVGNKGVIDLRLEGDAKYIGVSAAGLGEMRQSLENDKQAAAAEGVAFLDTGNKSAESGEALRIRVAARTTTISSIAKAGGQGLENILKQAAIWVGEDPEEVKVIPATDFADQTVAGAALLAFMQAKQLGLPLSLKSMHRMMKMNDMTEMDFDKENEEIENEAASMLGAMVGPFGGQQDDQFLDENGEPTAEPAPGATKPPASAAKTTPPNQNVPIKPHVRGSPVPLKKKVGTKGASARKNGK